MSTSEPRQVTLPNFPLVCGFVGCEEEAVRGLYPKDAPKLVFNVCRRHFEELKNRPYREDEEVTP